MFDRTDKIPNTRPDLDLTSVIKNETGTQRNKGAKIRNRYNQVPHRIPMGK